MRPAKFHRLLGKWLGILTFAFWIPAAQAVQIVTEVPNVTCERVELSRELKVYKDPGVFLRALNLLASDPEAAWQAMSDDNFLLTTLRGSTRMMKLGPAQPFKNFRAISQMYRAIDPHSSNLEATSLAELTKQSKPPLIVPIRLCGDSAYNDSLGFVLNEEFELAQMEKINGQGLPPSTVGHPIPQLPSLSNDTASTPSLAQRSKNSP